MSNIGYIILKKYEVKTIQFRNKNLSNFYTSPDVKSIKTRGRNLVGYVTCIRETFNSCKIPVWVHRKDVNRDERKIQNGCWGKSVAKMQYRTVVNRFIELWFP